MPKIPNEVGETPRIRGLPRNPTQKDNSILIAEKLRKDARARRMFVCAARAVSLETPIGATPTAAVEKKNPDRTISTDRRVIADMRRIKLGFNPSQYYPAMVPTVEELALLLFSMALSCPGIPVEMAKRDIASAFECYGYTHPCRW